MLGSFWFKHLPRAKKTKAPSYVLPLTRGCLKPQQLDSVSFIYRSQEE
ncbi:hypothetical protein PROVRUST_08561 [Providencia rustigianii DSM 4541]|uniref:Uncharacterized protein n=1 Tax=Providencia rustigianii DSM 4541 TaxID=500637 RepID=D1P8I0_9GAMM|nr:hypothetical protein PROVRUST_08561 [Providencia rustigianii DSM 4541]